MMKSYNINAITRGVNGFGLSVPDKADSIYTVTLAAATLATVVVPGSLPQGAIGSIGTINPIGNVGQTPIGRNKYIAIFRYGKKTANVWVAVNDTAAVPAGATLALAVSELCPDAYEVYAGDSITMISPTAATDVSVTFYNVTG